VQIQVVSTLSLVIEWPEYGKLDWKKIKPVPVVDRRDFLNVEELKKEGFKVVRVGR